MSSHSKATGGVKVLSTGKVVPKGIPMGGGMVAPAGVAGPSRPPSKAKTKGTK